MSGTENVEIKPPVEKYHEQHFAGKKAGVEIMEAGKRFWNTDGRRRGNRFESDHYFPCRYAGSSKGDNLQSVYCFGGTGIDQDEPEADYHLGYGENRTFFQNRKCCIK